MGLIVDTNVFISFERRGEAIDLSPWEPSEDVFLSVITVSELLMGVHRADTEARRSRRSAFVKAILTRGDLLMRAGRVIGAHDLIIAATARHHDLTLLTDNVEEFSRVPDLRVIGFAP